MKTKDAALVSFVSFLFGILVGRQLQQSSAYSEAVFGFENFLIQPRDVADLPSFTELLNASGSDKYYNHHYEHYYERILSTYRHQSKLKLLEIGADEGASLDLWDNYFTDPELIVGLAYKNLEGQPLVATGKRPNSTVEVIYGDQSKKSTMDKLRALGDWDIIIDDGSHVPQHVIYTFSELWQSVKPGGYYIIEDVETSYWLSGSEIYGYQLNETGFGAGPKFHAVEYMKQFIDVLVRRQVNATELSIMEGDDEMCSIEFGFNSIFVRRCGNKDLPAPAFKSFRPIDRERLNFWMQRAKSAHPQKDNQGNLIIQS